MTLTIGHGLREFNEFLGLLKAHNVKMLIDIRPSGAISSPYGWSGLQLPNLLNVNLIGYVRIPELVERPTGNTYEEGARKAIAFSREFKSGKVALFGQDASPDRCHRGADLPYYFAQAGVNLKHINERGELEEAEVSEPVEGARMHQEALF